MAKKFKPLYKKSEFNEYARTDSEDGSVIEFTYNDEYVPSTIIEGAMTCSSEEEMTTFAVESNDGATVVYTGETTDNYESGRMYYTNTVVLAPPTIVHDQNTTINFTDNSGRAVSYNVYNTDNELITNTTNTYWTCDYGSSGSYIYVTAIDNIGNESEPSNTEENWSCFVAGTGISMADGSSKNIEDLVIDDEIMSYDMLNNTYVTRRVSAIQHTTTKTLATVAFANGSTVEMVPSHPLYTKDGWHSITNMKGYPALVVGDEVLTATDWTAVENIDIYDVPETDVYSLTVSALKTTAGALIDDNISYHIYFANGIGAENHSGGDI